ncbi:dTDP-4-dehydrorhamnose reductase [Paenibacillus cisolokensis]|uniref:dTDP-4-dehydrorhamnose reductase n=1 Tax=Paenibacillus cisolokensis TaxID=1658519 RepID=UPI003D26D831
MTIKRLKVLITGASGQLGQELVRLPGEEGLELVGYSRDRLDITSLDDCRRVMDMQRPDAVIHCAAYTAVDKAEAEPDVAFRVNAAGTRNMAVASEEIGAKFVYISTDYVFDGKSRIPYNEYDQTNPQTVYGKSKLAGEQLTQTLHSRYFIVRTSWVFGKYGNNFVKTMLNLAKERKSLKVVRDQIGSPTYTFDLARFLLELVKTDYFGIYHVSNAGSCSWYEFANAIFEDSGIDVVLEPCTTADFPRPAPRPAYSVMDQCGIRSNGLNPLRNWREALRHYLQDSE